MCDVGKHLNLLFASRNSHYVLFFDALKIAVDKQLNLKIKKLFSRREGGRERGQIPE